MLQIIVCATRGIMESIARVTIVTEDNSLILWFAQDTENVLLLTIASAKKDIWITIVELLLVLESFEILPVFVRELELALQLTPAHVILDTLEAIVKQLHVLVFQKQANLHVRVTELVLVLILAIAQSMDGLERIASTPHVSVLVATMQMFVLGMEIAQILTHVLVSRDG